MCARMQIMALLWLLSSAHLLLRVLVDLHGAAAMTRVMLAVLQRRGDDALDLASRRALIVAVSGVCSVYAQYSRSTASLLEDVRVRVRAHRAARLRVRSLCPQDTLLVLLNGLGDHALDAVSDDARAHLVDTVMHVAVSVRTGTSLDRVRTSARARACARSPHEQTCATARACRRSSARCCT